MLCKCCYLLLQFVRIYLWSLIFRSPKGRIKEEFCLSCNSFFPRSYWHLNMYFWSSVSHLFFRFIIATEFVKKNNIYIYIYSLHYRKHKMYQNSRRKIKIPYININQTMRTPVLLFKKFRLQPVQQKL